AQAEVEYTLTSERWRLPHAHYGIPFLPPWLHIYGVDTSLLEAVVGVSQLRAAQASLCGTPGWRFVFGHYPTRSKGADGHGGSWFVRGALAPARVGDPQQRFGMATHGFAWVRVTEERLAIRFYDVKQTLLYSWETGLDHMTVGLPHL